MEGEEDVEFGFLCCPVSLLSVLFLSSLGKCLLPAWGQLTVQGTSLPPVSLFVKTGIGLVLLVPVMRALAGHPWTGNHVGKHIMSSSRVADVQPQKSDLCNSYF